MNLSPLGKTEALVSPLGLGLAALGRPGYINLGHAHDLATNYSPEEMELRTHAMLDEAYRLGIRYFDTARSYGKAEEFLSTWIEKNPEWAKTITIGSKWGYTYTANWAVQAEQHEVKEHSLAKLQGQWLESTTLLGKHLHLYQIHSATLESGVLQNHQVLDELARIRDRESTIIGLSVSGHNQAQIIEKALETERDGVHLFGSIQATFNVLEPSAGPMLAEAHRQGWGVIIKEALANGRLTPRNSLAALAPIMKIMEQQVAKTKQPMDALALAWVLQHSYIDVVLSGAAAPQHLQTNVQAHGLSLPGDVIEALDALKQSPVVYWKQRSSLTWN